MMEQPSLKTQKYILVALASACINGSNLDDWTPNDLINSAIILISIAQSLASKNSNYSKLPVELKSILSAEFRKNIQQSINLFTGINFSELAEDDSILSAEYIKETEEG